MGQHQSSFAGRHPLTMLPYWAATEPIGGVSDSIPTHPEDKHSPFDQHKRSNRRKPTPDKPSENPNKSHPDADHQIDEYA
jgi:hypothetical protein